jgi:AcrR family transcriptional regulator
MPATKKDQQEAQKNINRRKAGEKNRRIAQILGAAKKVFIAKGYDKASVREIALEAGFTTGAIYAYFKGKGELYGRILDEALHIQLDYLKKASQVKAPILEKLEALPMAYMTFAVDFPDEFKLLAIHFKKLDLPEELKKRLDDKFSKALTLVTNIFAEGIQQGCFPRDLDKKESAFLLYLATEGMLYATRYDYSPEFDFAPADLLDRIVRYLIAGMKTAGSIEKND